MPVMLMRRPLARTSEAALKTLCGRRTAITKPVGLSGPLIERLPLVKSVVVATVVETAVTTVDAISGPLAGTTVVAVGVSPVIRAAAVMLESVHRITKLVEPNAAVLACMHTIISRRG